MTGLRPRRQRGISLAVVLLMLVVILLLALSAAQVTLQGEKASRNDRDRQIALQAAEAALLDAELDIQGLPQASGRSQLFTGGGREGFPVQDCERGTGNPRQGLCAVSDDSERTWPAVDLIDDGDDAPTVPYGRFTGRIFPAGGGSLPARAPRYLIEAPTDGAAPAGSGYVYRITAIGFGMRPATRVVLQSHYRKKPEQGAGGAGYGRIGWREIINWSELRDDRTSD